MLVAVAGLLDQGRPVGLGEPVVAAMALLITGQGEYL
jgi:hypothetical protein